MDISINDLSFKGQFSDSEIFDCIKSISTIIKELRDFNGNNQIKRTNNLKNKKITSNKTIFDCLLEFQRSKVPELNDLARFMLANLTRGPFIENNIPLNPNLGKIKSICGEFIENTPLHVYISNNSGSIQAIISAKKTIYDKDTVINIGKGNNRITVLNFHNPSCLNLFKRTYQPNKKHCIRKDKKVNGKIHSKMDLDDHQAQICLNNGIQKLDSKYVYAFTNQKWYEFPWHISGYYHGYPINNLNRKSKTNINNIIRIFGNPPYPKGYSFF